MRIPTLFAAAVLTLSIVACSGSSSGTNNGTGTGTGTGTGGGPASGGGTCDAACRYYLQCKGVDSSNQGACVQSCERQGFTAQELSDVPQLSCPDGVALIERHPTPGPGTSGGGTSGGGGTGADCAGCQWDGSSCIWISPSTGLYQACGAGCCPGH